MWILTVFVVLVAVIMLGFWAFFGGNKTYAPRIHLLPVKEPKNSTFESVCTQLQNTGFKDLGVYKVAEMPVTLRGFVNSFEHFTAAVYFHPKAGAWADICVVYVDGTGLTVTNAPMGGVLDSRPGQEKVYKKGISLHELLAIAKTKRKVGPYNEPVTAKAFVTFFEDAYAKDMAWRQSKGGITAEEVRRVAEEGGRTVSAENAKKVSEIENEQIKSFSLLPCYNGGMCQFKDPNGSIKDIEGMPIGGNLEPRSCPGFDFICPAFMKDFGLTPQDINIRATLYRGDHIDVLVKQGKLEKDSAEYIALHERYEDILEQYPQEEYPKYYGEQSRE
ncbi:MAG: hypothetical protein A2231_05145 [Candidatus Firestonebacteria bacterium RIFOXYA2_FULL_40_8]|nr:MAG: hypothetical protein A2231_05145 [Candidatus Firestonebacteria bacterium RIFOXYA2_FULL_40_8]